MASNIGKEDLYHLDLVMDQSRSQWDWVISILSVFNSAPIYSNGKYKIISDRADLPLRQVFHAGNTMAGRTEIRVGGNPIKPNQINVQFADQNIHYTENVVIVQDSAQIFGAHEPIKLFDAALRGITRPTEAIREAGYLLLKQQRTKREITFTTGLEGLAVEPGDRCKVGVLMTNYEAGYGGRALDGSSKHIVFDMPVTTLSGYAYEMIVWHTAADTLEQRSLGNSPGSGWIVGSPTIGFSYEVRPGDRWAVGITSEDLFDARVVKVARDPTGMQVINAEQYASVFPGLRCPDSHTPVTSLFSRPSQPRSFAITAYADCTLCVSMYPAEPVIGGITAAGTEYIVGSTHYFGSGIAANLSGSFSPNNGGMVGDTIRFETGPASGSARRISAWWPASNAFNGPRLVFWSPPTSPPSSGDFFTIIPSSNQATGFRVYWPPGRSRGPTANSGWLELGTVQGQYGCVNINGTTGSLTVMIVPVSSWGVPNFSGAYTQLVEAPGCDDRAFISSPNTVFDTSEHAVYGLVLPGSVMGLRNTMTLEGGLFLTECCSPSGEVTDLSFTYQLGGTTIIDSLVVTLNDAANAATLTSSGGRTPATLTIEMTQLGVANQQYTVMTYDGPTASSGHISIVKAATTAVDASVPNSLGVIARFSHPDAHTCFNLVPDNWQMVVTEVDT